MIIKSMARKEASFSQLVGYMEKDGAERLLFHNFFGRASSPRGEIVREFLENAANLRKRANGNALYHEIISLSAGHSLGREESRRILADIGHEYLARRAPGQIAYGTLHRDSGHLHLHLCVSSNEIGKPGRARLSKSRFSEIQREVESLVIERYPELNQGRVYGKGRERDAERAKTTSREQQLVRRTGSASRKEEIAAAVADATDLSETRKELEAALAERGLAVYVRGKTVGVVDAQGKKYRLATLGADLQYSAAMERFTAREAMEIARQEAEEAGISRKEARRAELGRAMGRPEGPGRDRGRYR